MSVLSFLQSSMFRRMDEKRDSGLGTPENVVRYCDIRYGDDPEHNVLDVYRPKEPDRRLPVIVNVHGGGWVYGDKERYSHYCMHLCGYGFAVVNFTYRLAPRSKHPAQIEDTDRVFAWVDENADLYGFDRKNVFGIGDSAGAHLLSLYSCLMSDPGFREKSGIELVSGSAPKALVLNCGIYEIKKTRRKDVVQRLMKVLLPGKGAEEELHAVSPIEHLTCGFPPCLIMTSEGDFMKEQAAPMADRLGELGVPAELVCWNDPGHRLDHVFHLDLRSEYALKCAEQECGYLKDFL